MRELVPYGEGIGSCFGSWKTEFSANSLMNGSGGFEGHGSIDTHCNALENELTWLLGNCALAE